MLHNLWANGDLTDLILRLTGNAMSTFSAAPVPAVQNESEILNNGQTRAETFRPSMPSQLDFGAPSQETFDLMFQTMPYEASEPVLCKFLLYDIQRKLAEDPSLLPVND